MTLNEIDSNFTKQYENLLTIQRDIFAQLKTYNFNLEGEEITIAIRDRMYAFWHFNVGNKELLERSTNSTAADFFTESCLLFFKAYFEQGGKYKVHSERDIRKNKSDRRVIRPDISIWEDENCVAVIELKLSNGYKGKYMIPHLQEREHIIKEHHPEAFFGVLAFWNFFDTSDTDWKQKYFGLLDHRSNHHHVLTESTVERLMAKIKEKLE